MNKSDDGFKLDDCSKVYLISNYTWFVLREEDSVNVMEIQPFWNSYSYGERYTHIFYNTIISRHTILDL